MVLGSIRILELVKTRNLIANLSDRELTNPESCAIDLRIKEISRLQGKGFLGIEDRQTPDHVVLATFPNKPGTRFSLQPGEYYATETVETVHMPDNLFAIVKPRSTLFRSGIMLRAGVVDPGYSGGLHPGLFNASKEPFTIELGARYVQIYFMEISGGNVRNYEGQWQGGRKSAVIKEKQN